MKIKSGIFLWKKCVFILLTAAEYISDNFCGFFFFWQLYSLNDYKPPISKAKMTQITKAAIKAIKVRNRLTTFDFFSISHLCQNNRIA